MLLILTITNISYAQENLIKNADESFELFQYQEAIKYYQEALISAEPKKRGYIVNRLAESYLYSFQYKLAEEYYTRLMKMTDSKIQPQSYLDYGNVLKINGKYKEAKEQFRKYMTIVKDDQFASFLNRSLNWAISKKDSIKNYQILPTNLDISGQAAGIDFVEEGLVYAHARNKKPVYSMSVFDLDYAEMENPLHFMEGDKLFEGISFVYNESAPSIAKDGKVIYFSANAVKTKKGGAVSKKAQMDDSDEGISNMQLYMASFENGRYRKPVLLPFNNKQYNYTHPCISEDGNTLFFISDMPGGIGGFDIYKIKKQPNGSWGMPVNLGSRVNTFAHDLYPYLSNGLLFYSSKGFYGYGGYDVFMTVLDKNYVAQNPSINMGKPINSERDEVSFISADGGVSGYFASNRDNGTGADRIYRFIDRDRYIETSTHPKLIASKVKSNIASEKDSSARKESGEQLSNQISVIEQPVLAQESAANNSAGNKTSLPRVLKNQPPSSKPGAVKLSSAKPTGTNKLTTAPKTNKPSTSKVIVAQASSDKLSLIAKSDAQAEITATLQNQQETTLPVIQPIPFQYNDYKLNEKALLGLDTLVKVLKTQKDIKVIIAAHTDSRGTDPYNKALSARRAASLRIYLNTKGVSSTRITTIAYGEDRLLNKCGNGVICSEEEHAINRRIEITLLK
jgi:outer membrane protein OmpA-like peptidoglycan-associated protein/tetratricopeptide (TPR) repeat protein